MAENILPPKLPSQFLKEPNHHLLGIVKDGKKDLKLYNPKKISLIKKILKEVINKFYLQKWLLKSH